MYGLTGSQCLCQGSLTVVAKTTSLPFLYCTQTIQNGVQWNHQRAPKRIINNCYMTSRGFSRQVARQPDSYGASRKKHGFKHNDETARNHTRTPGTRRDIDIDVPFQRSIARNRIVDEQPHINTDVPFASRTSKPESLPSRQSSITSAEMTVFQNLLDLQSSRVKSSEDTAEKNDNSTTQDALHSAVQDAIGVNLEPSNSALIQEYLAEHHSAEQDRRPKIAEDKKAYGEIRRITALMQDAQTDTRAWEILHEHIIDKVVALDLDAPEPAEDSKHQTSTQHSAKQDIQTLPQTFPKLAAKFQDILQQFFPTSPYALALLPYLRHLGPSVFAMSASTELYNHHLRALYKHQLDLPGMSRTLSEMHEKVFDFDTDTLAIVDSVLNDAADAIKSGSPARKLFWRSDQMKDGLRSLETWLARIEEDIRERALSKAR